MSWGFGREDLSIVLLLSIIRHAPSTLLEPPTTFETRTVHFFRSFQLRVPGVHICVGVCPPHAVASTQIYRLLVTFFLVLCLAVRWGEWRICPHRPPDPVCFVCDPIFPEIQQTNEHCSRLRHGCCVTQAITLVSLGAIGKYLAQEPLFVLRSDQDVLLIPTGIVYFVKRSYGCVVHVCGIYV